MDPQTSERRVDMKTCRQLTALIAFAVFGTAGTACANKATLQFSGMTPYLGESLSIRVVDKASGDEVGREQLIIAAAFFNVPLWVMLGGHSYRFDFFTDHNRNGRYDAPPVYRAWRLEHDNAQSDILLPFTDNAVYTDIAWPDDPAWEAYLGQWQGIWFNHTFGSTAPVSAALWMSSGGDTLNGRIATSGVLGSPAPYIETLEAQNDPTADSLVIDAPQTAPWTGRYIIRKGNGYAVLNAPLLGLAIRALGHFGQRQMVMSFTISGAFNAEGVAFMTRTSETGVLAGPAPAGPSHFTLGQNFPNPFNPATAIPFSIGETAHVRLAVFDMLGRLMSVLVDETVGPGEHRADFNASGRLPSGVYLVRLETAGAASSRKMVLTD